MLPRQLIYFMPKITNFLRIRIWENLIKRKIPYSCSLQIAFSKAIQILDETAWSRLNPHSILRKYLRSYEIAIQFWQ
ncbi:hypothetical protein D3C76_1645780 [compost metagenome]